MAVPVFFTASIALLSHMLLLHSVLAQEDDQMEINCPKSFDCEEFGQLNFPLTNSTKYSHCGLFTVTCGQPIPQIQLGNEGPFYEVIGDISQQLPYKVQVQIRDQRLSNRGCDTFRSLNFSYSPIYSYTIISPNLTIFKCSKSSHAQPYFDSFYGYTICLDFDLYYIPPDGEGHQQSFHSDIPPDCSVIQLPMVIDPSIGKPDPTDPFQLLTPTYSIELHVSQNCWNCHQRGGQCQTDQILQKFYCKPKQVSGNLGKRRTKLIPILGGVAAGVGLIGILLFFIIWKLVISKHAISKPMVFWSKNKIDNYRYVEAFLKNYGLLCPKRYTYYEIRKMTNSFAVQLGQGGYGCVFKGELENGNLVAVKVLKGLKGSGQEFINEVATVSRTSHVNVVTLLGFCFEGHKRALVYEFMPNGSLDKFIYNVNSVTCRPLGCEALYQIAVGIARGLEYLHRGCNTQILHFDIKPHNILLDANFCPKISDFGLSKLCPRKDSTISLLDARGTAGYIAPEVFCKNFGSVSHKSDVYSYGMMVLEMVERRNNNVDVEVDQTSEIYLPHWIYRSLELNEEVGFHGTNEITRKMIIVGLWSIQTDPLHRPSMTRVVEMLEGSLESLQIPAKPYMSSADQDLLNIYQLQLHRQVV